MPDLSAHLSIYIIIKHLISIQLSLFSCEEIPRGTKMHDTVFDILPQLPDGINVLFQYAPLMKKLNIYFCFVLVFLVQYRKCFVSFGAPIKDRISTKCREYDVYHREI